MAEHTSIRRFILSGRLQHIGLPQTFSATGPTWCDDYFFIDGVDRRVYDLQQQLADDFTVTATFIDPANDPAHLDHCRHGYSFVASPLTEIAINQPSEYAMSLNRILRPTLNSVNARLYATGSQKSSHRLSIFAWATISHILRTLPESIQTARLPADRYSVIGDGRFRYRMRTNHSSPARPKAVEIIAKGRQRMTHGSSHCRNNTVNARFMAHRGAIHGIRQYQFRFVTPYHLIARRYITVPELLGKYGGVSVHFSPAV